MSHSFFGWVKIDVADLQAGLVMHLRHNEQPCPCGGYFVDPNNMEDDWKDVEDNDGPPHLTQPQGRTHMTVIHTNGVHYCIIRYCACLGAESAHIQLMNADLFLATTKKPRMIFTFQILDDFIRGNLECGTSAMNYYSKIRRITSNAFPHLVPVSHNEPMGWVWCWGLLKGSI